MQVEDIKEIPVSNKRSAVEVIDLTAEDEQPIKKAKQQTYYAQFEWEVELLEDPDCTGVIRVNVKFPNEDLAEEYRHDTTGLADVVQALIDDRKMPDKIWGFTARAHVCKSISTRRPQVLHIIVHSDESYKPVNVIDVEFDDEDEEM